MVDTEKKALIKKIFAQTYIWLLLLLMYAPIFVLIVFSFTDTDVLGQWNGFTLSLYVKLFQSAEIMKAVGNTLIIALVSSAIATVLGTLGAIGVYESKKHAKRTMEFANQIPVVTPEIVIALSLTVMFVFFREHLFPNFQFSFWTLLAGHLVLSTPFVYLNVKPKLEQMDPALYDAALDLGCTPTKALLHTTLPEIAPGVVSGFLIAITLSLDDFIVTAFTAGPGLLSGVSKISTISTYVQGVIKKHPLPPELRALCTIIFLVVLLVVLSLIFINSRQNKRSGRHAKARMKL